LRSVKNDIDVLLSNAYCVPECVVSPSEVLSAIGKLNLGKNDGNTGLSSDHFKNGCEELSVYISFLFSALLIHGAAPEEFISSTVIPIPKGKGLNPTDSANYRGIALSSIFGKVFDLFILNRFCDELCTSPLQFGFKAKSSTSMCTMVLKEVIAYYTAHGGSLYCIMLDATKAFDRVNYCKLFRELLGRNLPPTYLRLLFNFYTGHVTRVSWNGVCSDPFQAKNGVKQDGVISPVLFCLYIDKLMGLLQDSGVGCYIGEAFLGALAYADDLVLLAPTPGAMRLLLSLCDNFALNYDIVFNANKSKCLHFSPRTRFKLDANTNLHFSIGGKSVEVVSEWPHLGHIISTSFSDEAEIANKRNKLCGQINNCICFFVNRDPITKLSLLKAYCTSHYGSVLWDLSSPMVDNYCVVWRKGLMRVWNLPRNAHSVLLPPLCGVLPLFDELVSRTSSFVCKCLVSDNHIVNFVARNGLFVGKMSSPVGRNAAFCCDHFNVALDNIFSISKQYVQSFVNSNSCYVMDTVFSLLELLFIKHGFMDLPNFTNSDVDNLIYSISTN
jgi:hypothetical protein